MQHAARKDPQRGDVRGDRADRPAVRGDSPSANPYRLEVFTPSVREAVGEAGGWIVDKVLAGWTVTVITDEADNGARAVKILGSQVSVHSALLDATCPPPYAIALTSTFSAEEGRLQTFISQTLGNHATELRLIGTRPTRPRDFVLLPTTHLLSPAARAFKAHSLAAAGLPNRSVAVTERFLSAVFHEQDGARGRLIE
jgi:hypothetical protein